MPSELSRSELIALVTKIVNEEGSEEEIDQWLETLCANVPHPGETDLIYYADEELSPEEIVDQALSYRPIEM